MNDGVDNKNKNVWNKTLPAILMPFYGESLIGFLLRLDSVNGLHPGTIFREVISKKNEKPSRRRWLDKVKTIESAIDTEHLASMLNIRQDYLDNMKISSFKKRIFRYESRYTKNSLDCFSGIKICPLCIQEWKIPLSFLINDINICTMHGINLVHTCKCGTRIKLFDKREPLKCHNKRCKEPFLSLIKKSDYKDLDNQLRMQSNYNTYLVDSFPLARHNDKIFNSLKVRIDLLLRFQEEAVNYIIKSCPLYIQYLDKFLYKHPIRKHLNIYKYLNLSNIIKFLTRTRITPYQFLNFPTIDNPKFQCKVIKIGITYFDHENNSVNSCDVNNISEKHRFHSYENVMRQLDIIILLLKTTEDINKKEKKYAELISSSNLERWHDFDDHPIFKSMCVDASIIRSNGMVFNDFIICGEVQVNCDELTITYPFRLEPFLGSLPQLSFKLIFD